MKPIAELPLPMGGYVLAGGHSSRMGRDKALVSLAGKRLIEHAVGKLRGICADVQILSADPALTAYAPIVADIHGNSGPLGGIEAALLHTSYDWNLFLPVDVPLLPSLLLTRWGSQTLHSPMQGIRILRDQFRFQPGVCLIHRAVAPLITRAVLQNQLSLISAFQQTGREAEYSFTVSSTESLISALVSAAAKPSQQFTPAQLSARDYWFLNLNTPQDLALAEAHADALDA